MMRLAALILAFGLCQAQYGGPTQPPATTASGSGYEATTAGYAATTAGPVATTAGYVATTAANYGTTAGNAATTGSSNGGTTESSHEGGCGKESNEQSGGDSSEEGSGEHHKGHFQCHKRKNATLTYKNKILDLEPLASLENICAQTCQENKCLGKLSKPAGLLAPVSGAVQCLLDDISNITPFQQCLFPCFLKLNLLETCQVKAIVGDLLAVCPDQDKERLCVSACACCALKNGPLDACVKVCLTEDGIKVNANVNDIKVKLP